MKITNWLFHHPKKFALFVFCFFLFWYGLSLPSFNTGYADADEFLSLAPEWGIAHPPGYSLFVGLLHLAINLPLPYTTPAFRANLVSATAAALSLAIFTMLTRQLYLTLTPSKNRYSVVYVFAVFCTTLAVAFNQQIWLYAQITEKYIFAAPFIMIMIYLGHQILTQKKVPSSSFLLFGLAYGLGLGHHQSLVFLLPFFLFIGFRKIGWSLGGMLAGIGVTVLLLWLQITRQNTLALSWYSGDGLTGLVNILTRQDFRGQIYETGAASNGYLPTLQINRIVSGLNAYLNQMLISFGWWILLPLTTAGAAVFNKKIRPWLLPLSSPFLLLGPLLAGYLNWPADIGSQAITERFYLISFFTLLPIIFIGLCLIGTRLILALNILNHHQRFSSSLLFIVPSLLIIQAIRTFPSISLKNFDLVSKLYQTILTEVKPNSLVSCYSDTSCFALLYEQSVNHLRPDVQIVPLTYPLVHHQLETASLQRFTYPDNPFKLFDIITNNIDKRPVYVVDLNQYYFNFFGLANAFMFYLPSGYAAQLSRTMPTSLPEYSYPLSAAYPNQQFLKSDHYRQFLLSSFAQLHISHAYTYLQRGERVQAQQLLNFAGNIAAQLVPQLNENLHAARLQTEQILPNKKFAPNATVPNPKILIEAVPQYLKAGKNATAYKLLLGAISIDPESIPARAELAKMYEQFNEPVFAKLEYQHLLLLDPDNQEALTGLSRLP